MRIYEKQMSKLLILTALILLVFNMYQIFTEDVPAGNYQEIANPLEISLSRFITDISSPFSLVVIAVVVILIIAVFAIYRPSKPVKKPKEQKKSKPSYQSRFR